MSKKERATFGQASRVLTVIMDQKPTVEQVDALLESGILTILMKVDISSIDRSMLRKFFGLPAAESEANYVSVIKESSYHSCAEMLRVFRVRGFSLEGGMEDLGYEDLASVFDLNMSMNSFAAHTIKLTEDLYLDDVIDILCAKKLRLPTFSEFLRAKLSNVDDRVWTVGPMAEKDGKYCIAAVRGTEIHILPAEKKFRKDVYYLAIPSE